MAEKSKFSSFSAVFDFLINMLAFVAGLLLLFQVISVTVDVLLRYFLNKPIVGVVAFNEWSLLYIAFLGAPWLQREGGHVKMDLLLGLLNQKASKMLWLFSNLLGVAVCIVLVWYGILVTRDQWIDRVYDYFKLENFPIAVITAVIPLGGFFLLIQLLREISREVRIFMNPDVADIKNKKNH